MSPILLTICIATYNRAEFLKDTLSSIVTQMEAFDDVELLVVDGNSSDHTAAVVTKFQSINRHVSYLKLNQKGGVDKDFDLAVQNASGLYCWLFTDDDLLKEGAVGLVRASVLIGVDLVVVNSEICDYDLNRVFNKNSMQLEVDIQLDLSPVGRDRFFKLCATHITFIGAIVIKRSAWVAASREAFYGSRFIHVGVISTLSDSTTVLVLSQPIIKIRLGNAEWSNITFYVWTQLWPNLIWSFSNLSLDCKNAICKLEPWKSITFLLWSRALGTYSFQQYKKHISPKPISIYKFVALVIASFPQLLPRFLYFSYANILNNELILYYLNDGGKSKNKWLSAK
jgi:glycosyltransferase involved in cell wall biosynthesis